MTLADQINVLTANLVKLPASKQGFTASLIAQYNRRRTLSEKQIPYVAQFVELLMNDAPAQEPENVGDFAPVLAMFAKAGLKLKFPKITLEIAGQTCTLSVAGLRSAKPGWVNVATKGSWNDRSWYGRVSPSGEFEAGKSLTPEMAPELLAILRTLALNPVEVVKAHGLLTGNCCFCNAGLTDARSKAAGFGPVCADNYGLKEEWKQAAKAAEAAEAVAAPITAATLLPMHPSFYGNTEAA